MSVESLDEEVRTILVEGPPLEWFVGLASQQRGIMVVAYSDVLLKMGSEVEQHLNTMGHYLGLRPSTPEGKARAQETLAAADEYLVRVTGFGGREIVGKAYDLSEIFRSQREAPFQIELLD